MDAPDSTAPADRKPKLNLISFAVLLLIFTIGPSLGLTVQNPDSASGAYVRVHRLTLYGIISALEWSVVGGNRGKNFSGSGKNFRAGGKNISGSGKNISGSVRTFPRRGKNFSRRVNPDGVGGKFLSRGGKILPKIARTLAGSARTAAENLNAPA